MPGHVIKKVLVYRLGSLGDTVVALPCFHLISRTFPQAERKVLTNFPVSSKAAPLQAILGNSGLIHDFLPYSVGDRTIGKFWGLRDSIRHWSPDLLIYLTPFRGKVKLLRDFIFFKLCGIPKMIGFPFHKKLQENPYLETCFFESESARLARCLAALGPIDLDDPENWDLQFTSAEKESARGVLKGLDLQRPFISCGPGTKMDVKDWGVSNWKTLLGMMAKEHPTLGIIFVGSKEEFPLAEEISEVWKGPRINLCGECTPRQTAEVMKFSKLFVGVDSGPMHLAASVGLPCVAIFSARDKPGVWFPHGRSHQIIYHKTPCYFCRLEICVKYHKKCIESISPVEVFEAFQRCLGGNNG